MKRRLLSSLLVVVITALSAMAALPKAEIRAVWLTAALDWPSSPSNPTAQKNQLKQILDKLQAANFNTVVFQVQVKGDVAWKSSYQPAMYSFTGNGSKELSYDVAQYVIDQCHERDMECHAWIIPYRIGSTTEASKYQSNAKKHPLHSHPEWCRLYNGSYYLDPGLPAVTEYLLDMYRELVTDYNFDGVSFDYTRYPTTDGFPDDDTYANHNPYGMTRADWRRNNINSFMARFYEMAKGIRPELKVGSAPIGTYKNLPGYGNMTAYGVYQDPIQWMTSGHHDLIIPQLYYNEKYGFTDNMNAWGEWIKGGTMAVGLAPYKVNDGVNDWDTSVIYDQIEKIRKSDAMSGICFFRTQYIIGTDNAKYVEMYNKLQSTYFAYPAHIPSIESMGVTKPSTPTGVTQEYIDGNYVITWDEAPASDNVRYHTVYLLNGSHLNTIDPKWAVGHKVHGNTFSYPSTKTGQKFAVSAFDQGYYESEPATASTSGVEEMYALESSITYDNYTLRVNGSRKIDAIEIYAIDGAHERTVKVNAASASVECGKLSRGVHIARVNYADGGSDVHKIMR